MAYLLLCIRTKAGADEVLSPSNNLDPKFTAGNSSSHGISGQRRTNVDLSILPVFTPAFNYPEEFIINFTKCLKY